MPIPVDVGTTLTVLFSTANDHEADAIREVAIRAGLLQHCRCGWYNPADAERCQSCRTRVLPDTDPTTVPALGLVAVRDYLTKAHGDTEGTAKWFVAACRAGICGGIAFDVADDVIAGAEHYSYDNSWPVIAEEIVAGVEARAAANGAARVAPATT
ncbi:hypothetical protein [Actinokineospora iranica]|uniref:Uncharacterized protein n=1 Tax=Actinokineospora iranica TaxID=1271860 RepID=A0A1G6VNL3_9PSEU|nr:hypothetical protein [Actinokineospora iranica]SDD55131.1 hypothetical protein SAMN05216174_11312 [Actinokineospora iranica]